MIVRLQAVGFIEAPGADAVASPSQDFVDRRAMLVYSGEFLSKDGPVTVTSDQIKGLVKGHNSVISKVKRLASGAVPLKHYPPVQLDHSESARDTVGRLIGDIEEGEHETEAGNKVPAIFGTVRFLGRDNVERVNDGRWTHLSCGADFERGHFAELSVTPFPAAPHASLLSKGEPVYHDMPDGKTKLYVYVDEKTGKFCAYIDDKKIGEYATKETAVEAAQAEAKAKIVPEVENQKELTAMALDATKLAAAKAKITELAAGFKTLADSSRLQAAQSRVLVRLSKLRSEAKITPAEIKKMDIVKLAGSTDKEIDLVLKTYEDREPVILVGQVGSVKATELSQLSAKQKIVSEIEADARRHMTSLAKPSGATAKLSFGAEGEGGAEKPGHEGGHAEPDHDQMAYMEREHQQISQLYSEGKHEDAKTRLKAFLSKHLAMGGGSPEYTQSNAVETEKHLAGLAENVVKMQTQLDDVMKVMTEEVLV